MSITKRRLEIMEWIEGIQDRLLDDRISQPIARHLLRKLPNDIQLMWINASAPQDGYYQDGPSASSPQNYDKHEAEVLQKLRYTLTSACMARLTDPDLEDLYFSQGYERAEMALGDHDAISADAFTLKDEIDASQDAFPDIAMNFDDITLFGSGVKGALNDAGELFTAVGEWQRYSMGKAYWSFWREWYQGFLDGSPMDWELQRRVAMIPDADWEKGPEHIARVIEDIRKDFDGAAAPTQERFEELEPASLERILRAPTLSAGQIEAAAQGIKDTEYRYLNETGANQLPDPFLALPEIAGSMLRVSQKIRQHASDPTVEDALRQEIGRLNARVIELEKELEALRKAPAPVFLPALKEQIGKSLGDWKMYGAMFGALWLISGDDLGMQQRLENLEAARAVIFGTEATTPDVLPAETSEPIEI